MQRDTDICLIMCDFLFSNYEQYSCSRVTGLTIMVLGSSFTCSTKDEEVKKTLSNLQIQITAQCQFFS